MNTEILGILEKYWGYKKFRPLQEEIIQSVLDGNDTLALMPTGGGKSLCFQVPALASDGLCLVITPLIALMKDQVERLNSLGIKASSVHTGLHYTETDRILNNCLYGNTRFLYLSPERLTTDLFIRYAPEFHVNLIAVDEAHCISQWGYDFRPSYLKIAAIRQYYPNVPVLAVTATATGQVKKDIQEKLAFRKSHVFQQSFDRNNLVYGIVHTESKNNRILEILSKVQGTGIVYVRTRKATMDISEFLNSNGITADFYHGGLDHTERTQKQEAWMSGKIRIIVATNAFGMGIDKPDVRIVIHFHLPDSIEAYYQEAGRAGRDLKKSWAVIVSNENDRTDLIRRTGENVPDISEIKKVYRALGNYCQLPVGAGENAEFDFDFRDFCSRFNLESNKTYNSIKVLENCSLIKTSENVYLPSRLFIKYNYNELYGFQVNNPNYEPLIKTLLRSYEGLFDIFTRINETEIAKRMGTTGDKVIAQLKNLDELGVVEYIYQKNNPQLYFLTARMDEEDLPLHFKMLLERKRIVESKSREMLRYTFDSNACRTKFLLDYFGETFDKSCGHCDYCLKNKDTGLTGSAYDAISSSINTLLAEKECSAEEIVQILNSFKKEKVAEVIRWMTDHSFLVFNNNKYKLPGK